LSRWAWSTSQHDSVVIGSHSPWQEEVVSLFAGEDEPREATGPQQPGGSLMRLHTPAGEPSAEQQASYGVVRNSSLGSSSVRCRSRTGSGAPGGARGSSFPLRAALPGSARTRPCNTRSGTCPASSPSASRAGTGDRQRSARVRPSVPGSANSITGRRHARGIILPCAVTSE